MIVYDVTIVILVTIAFTVTIVVIVTIDIVVAIDIFVAVVKLPVSLLLSFLLLYLTSNNMQHVSLNADHS